MSDGESYGSDYEEEGDGTELVGQKAYQHRVWDVLGDCEVFFCKEPGNIFSGSVEVFTDPKIVDHLYWVPLPQKRPGQTNGILAIRPAIKPGGRFLDCMERIVYGLKEGEVALYNQDWTAQDPCVECECTMPVTEFLAKYPQADNWRRAESLKHTWPKSEREKKRDEEQENEKEKKRLAEEAPELAAAESKRQATEEEIAAHEATIEHQGELYPEQEMPLVLQHAMMEAERHAQNQPLGED